MSRKIWIAFLFAVSLSLLANAAEAQWSTEAQCEVELFPISPEATADWSFDLLGSPGPCLDRENQCHNQCLQSYYEELALCLAASGGNPYGFLLCGVVVLNRQIRCHDQCTRRAIECLSVGGGAGAGGGPFNQDTGGGGGCGLSSEYSQPCGWGP